MLTQKVLPKGLDIFAALRRATITYSIYSSVLTQVLRGVALSQAGARYAVFGESLGVLLCCSRIAECEDNGILG